MGVSDRIHVVPAEPVLDRDGQFVIVKKKIESFSSRFSIFYDSMSSDCDLSHALSPRNPRLVANHRLFAFDTQTGRRVR